MSHTTATVQIVRGEILPVSINVGPALGQGETVQSIEASVVEETTRMVRGGTIVGTPTVTGTSLAITIDARGLMATNTYMLKTLLTIVPEVKVVAILTPLHCVA